MAYTIDLEGRTVLVMGVANKKSVAYHVARLLADEGATLVISVRSEERRESVARLFPETEIHVCDVEDPAQIEALAREVTARHPDLHGLLHSIAFARYEGGWKAFHEVAKDEFLQAIDISCYSLIAVCRAFADAFTEDASVVTVSISTTTMAAENYGYMAPIKAALDSSLAFLAKSFAERGVRFNAVKAGLLKTRASAGIPGYVDAYLFAEQATLRKKALTTGEVAAAAAFLLSPASSGINAQGIVLDAGMSTNYFDRDLVRRALREE